jgi:hypothetical protein
VLGLISDGAAAFHGRTRRAGVFPTIIFFGCSQVQPDNAEDVGLS